MMLWHPQERLGTSTGLLARFVVSQERKRSVLYLILDAEMPNYQFMKTDHASWVNWEIPDNSRPRSWAIE